MKEYLDIALGVLIVVLVSLLIINSTRKERAKSRSGILGVIAFILSLLSLVIFLRYGPIFVVAKIAIYFCIFASLTALGPALVRGFVIEKKGKIPEFEQ